MPALLVPYQPHCLVLCVSDVAGKISTSCCSTTSSKEQQQQHWQLLAISRPIALYTVHSQAVLGISAA